MPRTSRLAVLLLATAAATPALVAQTATITVYEHINFTGKSLTVTAPTATLDSFWNDQISSIKVHIGGEWALCRKKEFNDCLVFGADVADLRQLKGWNDQVSSLAPVQVELEVEEVALASAPASALASAPDVTEPGRPASAPAAPAAAPPPDSAGSAPAPSSASSSSHSRASKFAGKPAVVNGYLEYRHPDGLIVEGQRLVVGPKTKFHGAGDAKSVANIPLGYQIEASGVRRADGGIDVARIDAKPNGEQMYEGDIMQATNQLESAWRESGEMLTAAAEGQVGSMGKLHQSGPDYERARGIVDRLLPDHVPPEQVRVYVVENPEWNAMAMGNYSIYVFKGIMDDLDDDELSLVIGHEIAHASHEHSRKQQKRAMWTGLLSTGAGVLVGSQLEGGEAYAAGMLTSLGVAAFANGYSRNQEDQADRVGMRYAYEAGYDVSKGPGLWMKFAEKYGEAGKAQNILFGDHSRSSTRAAALQQEIVFNYPEAAQ